MSKVVKVTKANYGAFHEMVQWRIHGDDVNQYESLNMNEQLALALDDPNLYLYAIEAERMIGWISLIYLPKVGKYNGKGHVYVDELWVHPSSRGLGYAKKLMMQADQLKEQLNCSGVRLYVNTNNETAKGLYEACGYEIDGSCLFMSKE